MIIQVARKMILCGANQIISGVLELPDIIFLRFTRLGIAGSERKGQSLC